jgi:hypothetical protein
MPPVEAARFFTDLGEFCKTKPDHDALNVFGKPWVSNFSDRRTHQQGQVR